MWIPYEETKKHAPDFKVRYRFYSVKEGGRKTLPYQGYRCDFSYDGDDILIMGIYMIHPEFEDEYGNILMDDNKSVNFEGTARMWILTPEMRREIHQYRIQIGTKGFFTEGSRKVGEIEVIETLDLISNTNKL